MTENYVETFTYCDYRGTEHHIVLLYDDWNQNSNYWLESDDPLKTAKDIWDFVQASENEHCDGFVRYCIDNKNVVINGDTYDVKKRKLVKK